MFRDNKFVRSINRNREIIILVIAMIIFGFFIIRALNDEAKNNYNKIEDNDTNNTISSEVKRSKDTITTDKSIETTKADENYNLIKNFVDYCNKNDIDEAYNLLTPECKENVYPSIESFNKNYIQVVFEQEKKVEIQSWITNKGKYTYLVTYTGDIIATGDNEEKEYQDYITVDYETKKININKYIGRIEKEIEKEINNINFKIDYIDLYKDYEVYHLKVSNKNDTQIILDNLSSTSNTYIETDKEKKINCSNYEAGINAFKYDVGVSKDIKLKFMKQYNVDIVDEKLVFSSTILNTDNPEETETITIEL